MPEVTFTALLGAEDRGPLSFLLRIDGFGFLLDCGWNDLYDVSLLDPIKEVLPAINAGERKGALPADLLNQSLSLSPSSIFAV